MYAALSLPLLSPIYMLEEPPAFRALGLVNYTGDPHLPDFVRILGGNRDLVDTRKRYPRTRVRGLLAAKRLSITFKH
jgi:hypothetical protein